MQQQSDRTTKPQQPGKSSSADSQPHAVRHTRKPPTTYRARPASAFEKQFIAADPMSQRAAAHQIGAARRKRTRLFLFLLVGLLLVGGVAAYAFVLKPVANVVDNLNHTITDVFVTPVPVRPAPGGNANSTPVPVVYPNWEKHEPVNILLLGLDYRPQDKDSRSDTMIVVHIDPVNKTASMVSIPRDLWVEIPGQGEDRINSAFQHGEDDKTIAGGGPGLAMATVEYNLGIKIHYFAQVDFTGFEKIVDTMGGVTVDVPKPLVDNEYPLTSYGQTVTYGATRIYIPAGLQHMDGRTALQYARSRHADSDLGRNSRQQQVLLAIRQQGMSLNMLSHLNDILSQLSGTVKTDLSILQVGSLAQLAKDIKGDSIHSMVIDADMVKETILPNGADVLVPNWEIIRPKVQQLFADPGLAKEAARLSLQNGTTVSGEAKKLKDELVAGGYNVPDLVSAPNQGSYPKSVIIDYTNGKMPLTVAALVQKLNLSAASVRKEDSSKAPKAASDGKPVDIAVIVGDDRLTPTP